MTDGTPPPDDKPPAPPREPPPPDRETARIESAVHATKSMLPSAVTPAEAHTPDAAEAPVETASRPTRAGTPQGTLPSLPEAVSLAPQPIAAAPAQPIPPPQGGAKEPPAAPEVPPLTVGAGRVRTFLALNFPLGVVRAVMDEVAAQKAKVAQAGLDVAWVPAANVHLTLKFLGSVPREAIEAIRGRLERELPSRTAFELEARGLGAFPSLEKPKVLWVGVKTHPALAALARDVEAWMEALGVAKEERAYHPHLTVGRVKGGQGSLVELWRPREQVVFGTGRMQELVLYESRTHRAGAEYVALARVPLGTPSKK